jgi:hypothetical protein
MACFLWGAPRLSSARFALRRRRSIWERVELARREEGREGRGAAAEGTWPARGGASAAFDLGVGISSGRAEENGGFVLFNLY